MSGPAGISWRMTRKGYFIAQPFPGGRAAIVSEQRGSSLWRFVVHDKEAGVKLSCGHSFQEAPAAMDAVESCTRPVEPNKAIAAQFMDFMPGQDEQQQLGKES